MSATPNSGDSLFSSIKRLISCQVSSPGMSVKPKQIRRANQVKVDVLVLLLYPSLRGLRIYANFYVCAVFSRVTTSNQ